jgi:hypothetical protein
MRALFFVFLALFLHACGPKIEPSPTSGPTSANGQVIDKNSGKPVSYAEVRLVSEKKGATAMSRGTEKTVFADENGNYAVSFDADAEYFYKLSASAEHYFADNIGTYIDPGIQNINVQLALEAKGYIKFNIINEGNKDTIEYRISGYFKPAIELYGFSRDTIIFREGIGNKDNPIGIRNRTSTGDIYNSTQIFIPALDTIEYTIKY